MTSQVFVNGVTLSDGAGWAQDVDNVVYQFLSGVAGTNTITATGPAGLGAYVAGRKFRFIPAATNTGPATINITGTAALGARNIFCGGAALKAGELTIGIPVEITDDGTQFNITSMALSQGTWVPSLGGSATYTTQTGSWTKIGRLCFVAGTLIVNAIGTGSTTTVSGLPFSPAADCVIGVVSTSTLATAVVSIAGIAASGSSTIQFRSRVAANAADAANAIFQNGTVIAFSGCFSI